MREMTAEEAVLIFAVVAFGMFFAAPILAEANTMGWSDWIYRWQTILGAALAVFAAWITVRQMRVSDAKSDQRHFDLMTREHDAEKRRIERAINPQRTHLSERVAYFNGLSAGLFTADGVEKIRIAKIEHEAAAQSVRAVGNILARAAFVEGSVLFDGELAARCANARDACENFDHYYSVAFYPNLENLARRPEVVRDFDRRLANFATLVDRIVQDLDDLAGRYGVVVK